MFFWGWLFTNRGILFFSKWCNLNAVLINKTSLNTYTQPNLFSSFPCTKKKGISECSRFNVKPGLPSPDLFIERDFVKICFYSLSSLFGVAFLVTLFMYILLPFVFPRCVVKIHLLDLALFLCTNYLTLPI